MTTIITDRKKGSSSPRRVALDFSEDPGRTKQEFKKECDINNIMAKFRKTGAIEHVQKHGAVYGEASGVDFTEAMRIVTHGNTLWEELPSHIKDDYSGPAEFLDFVHDEANLDAVRELFGEAPASIPPAEPEAPLAPPVAPATPDPAPPAPTPSVPSEG